MIIALKEPSVTGIPVHLVDEVDKFLAHSLRRIIINIPIRRRGGLELR
jgi:hypothetical protein